MMNKSKIPSKILEQKLPPHPQKILEFPLEFPSEF